LGSFTSVPKINYWTSGKCLIGSKGDGATTCLAIGYGACDGYERLLGLEHLQPAYCQEQQSEANLFHHVHALKIL
jgi:hypothetical protein